MSILCSNTVSLRGARVKRQTVPWVEDGAAYEATRGRGLLNARSEERQGCVT